jgi:hypothetical protein
MCLEHAHHGTARLLLTKANHLLLQHLERLLCLLKLAATGRA